MVEELDLKTTVIKAYYCFIPHFARDIQNQRQEITLLFKKLELLNISSVSSPLTLRFKPIIVNDHIKGPFALSKSVLKRVHIFCESCIENKVFSQELIVIFNNVRPINWIRPII